jgi:hypothetical protein
VQVKTSTFRRATKRGGERWQVAIATNGGNRSWGGVAKLFDRSKVDYLFVLVGDGRRWFIPAPAVEGHRGIVLGGAKYSEFEIDRGTPFEALIYPKASDNRIERPFTGECLSGQKDVTVNHATYVYAGSNPASPIASGGRGSSAATAQILFRPKRQATIPRRPCEEAGLLAGDRLRVSADGPGRVVLERIDPGRDPAA